MKRKHRIWFCTLVTVLIIIFSCKKDKDLLIIMDPWIAYGSMNDQEGNTYKTIDIGTQTWMVENLTTTRFNDGTSIPIVPDATSWSSLSTPACCWQENNPARKVTYGVLYNWYAVNTGKLCPIGWHVPSDEEWNLLTDYLGGENIAGSRLKESGFRHWKSPNTDATNESHFSALPGGYRGNSSDALFENLGKMGCWWSTANNEDWATNRFMYDNNTQVQKFLYPKQWGLSVRCVRYY